MPTYLGRPALVHPTAPDNTNPEPGYFESQSTVEFPDQLWGTYDEAEYPDQALLCPDAAMYPGEHYPGEGDPEGSGYEF